MYLYKTKLQGEVEFESKEQAKKVLEDLHYKIDEHLDNSNYYENIVSKDTANKILNEIDVENNVLVIPFQIYNVLGKYIEELLNKAVNGWIIESEGNQCSKYKIVKDNDMEKEELDKDTIFDALWRKYDIINHEYADNTQIVVKHYDYRIYMQKKGYAQEEPTIQPTSSDDFESEEAYDEAIYRWLEKADKIINDELSEF